MVLLTHITNSMNVDGLRDEIAKIIRESAGVGSEVGWKASYDAADRIIGISKMRVESLWRLIKAVLPSEPGRPSEADSRSLETSKIIENLKTRDTGCDSVITDAVEELERLKVRLWSSEMHLPDGKPSEVPTTQVGIRAADEPQ